MIKKNMKICLNDFCCDNTLYIGAFRHCDSIVIDTRLADQDVKVGFKYGTLSGFSYIFNNKIVNGQLTINTSFLNEDAIVRLQIYDVNGNLLEANGYDCISFDVKLVKGMACDCIIEIGDDISGGTPGNYLIIGPDGTLQDIKPFQVQEGSNVTIDYSDPLRPVISATGGGGGGIPDAPFDSKLYGREDGTWKEISIGSGDIDGNINIGNPNNNSVQIGNDGDAINLNVDIPVEFQTLANTYTGFDYIKDDFSAFLGVLKGLDFAPLGFTDQDIIGTFAVEGDPFNATNPDGVVFLDGIWHDNVTHDVGQQKSVMAFDSDGMHLTLQAQMDREQISLIQGDNAEQNQDIIGNDAEQSQVITGDNAVQISFIQGDNAQQTQKVQGDDGENYRLIEGDDAIIIDRIEGERGAIKREVIDVVSGNSFLEEVNNNAHTTVLDGDYDYTADNFYFKGAAGIRQIVGTTQVVTGGTGFSVRQGQNVSKHSLFTNGNFQLGRNGAYNAINYIESGQKMGFFNAEAVAQQIVPIGSTNDEIIQALQALGLFIES